MNKNNKIGTLSIVTLLLGIACIITTVAYIAMKAYGDREYNRRWGDYDDCGLA